MIFKAWLHTGVLLRFKYSLTVGGASLLDNIVQVCHSLCYLMCYLLAASFVANVICE